jgi:hypothetical protein
MVLSRLVRRDRTDQSRFRIAMPGSRRVILRSGAGDSRTRGSAAPFGQSSMIMG